MLPAQRTTPTSVIHKALEITELFPRLPQGPPELWEDATEAPLPTIPAANSCGATGLGTVRSRVRHGRSPVTASKGR